MLTKSELQCVALAEKVEEAGPSNRINRALQNGRLGSLPCPAEQTARQYVYALSPVAELLEDYCARVRSAMEAEGRQLLEDALTKLLSLAICRVPDFPAELVVAAEIPPGQHDIMRRT